MQRLWVVSFLAGSFKVKNLVGASHIFPKAYKTKKSRARNDTILVSFMPFHIMSFNLFTNMKKLCQKMVFTIHVHGMYLFFCTNILFNVKSRIFKDVAPKITSDCYKQILM